MWYKNGTFNWVDIEEIKQLFCVKNICYMYIVHKKLYTVIYVIKLSLHIPKSASEPLNATPIEIKLIKYKCLRTQLN